MLNNICALVNRRIKLCILLIYLAYNFVHFFNSEAEVKSTKCQLNSQVYLIGHLTGLEFQKKVRNFEEIPQLIQEFALSPRLTGFHPVTLTLNFNNMGMMQQAIQ